MKKIQINVTMDDPFKAVSKVVECTDHNCGECDKTSMCNMVNLKEVVCFT